MKKILITMVTMLCFSGCSTVQNVYKSASDLAGSGMNRLANIIPERNKPVAPETVEISEPPDFQKPIDFIPEALGNYEWKITTDNKNAQEYFKQGMQLRYAYNVNEAARSMAEARRIDPNCAMCYWGEAFALGSFLNGHMTAEKNTYARKAITRASILAKNNANQMERDLIEASVVRYPRNWTDEMARDKQKRRPTYQAFADSMEKVYEKYPNNNDIATVYAVALFMLEERRGYRDINNPDLIRLHNVLTKVLDDDISHPGACHLYIHATESSQRPDLALNCADVLSDAIPAASHIQHMPSHTFNRTGHWAKAVVSGQKAQQSDLQALKNKGFSYGDTHNLHMLLYAASYDGQSAAATQAGKDYRKLTDNYENKDFPVQYAPYEILTLIRFGRFDEVLQKTNKPKNDFASALWDFAKGYASLKTGDKKTAADMHKQVLEYADRLDGRFRGDSHQTLLNTVAYILEGEMHIAEGDLNSAIRSFEEAVKFENALEYSEPEPLPFSARHWLGAALYSNGQYQEAEQVYKDELQHHPHNGWSLYGLQQSLAAQGLNDEDINQDLKESWARSNLWITSSRF